MAGADNVDRVRALLADRRDIAEKRMFGGVCFMQGEHMLCGASPRGFLFRVGEAGEAGLLGQPGAQVMAHGGRRMRGFVQVQPEDPGSVDLELGLRLALAYVATLPPKTAKRPRR